MIMLLILRWNICTQCKIVLFLFSTCPGPAEPKLLWIVCMSTAGARAALLSDQEVRNEKAPRSWFQPGTSRRVTLSLRLSLNGVTGTEELDAATSCFHFRRLRFGADHVVRAPSNPVAEARGS